MPDREESQAAAHDPDDVAQRLQAEMRATVTSLRRQFAARPEPPGSAEPDSMALSPEAQ